ncbi:MAG: zinc-ribbon domain-containing protein [Spirochaetes bacterium]|nr:zinc-ribbon domain-containing protein [Spirochaetota bacterium]
MVQCRQCGHENPDGSLYCNRCGAGLDAPAMRTPKKKPLRVMMFLPMAILLGVAMYMVVGKGCSSVSGNLVSTGRPLGDFTFTPEQCRSGQRMQFFGVGILGKGQNDGAVLPMIDAARGKLVKIEIPGTCRPPDFEECTEVIVEPKQCSRFAVSIRRTGTEVNDIRLMEGSVELDCSFPEGGTLKGRMEFSRCD